MSAALTIATVGLVLVAVLFLGLLVWEIYQDLAERFRTEAKVKRFARQRHRELLHQKTVMSNEAMRAIEEMRRQYWGMR